MGGGARKSSNVIRGDHFSELTFKGKIGQFSLWLAPNPPPPPPPLPQAIRSWLPRQLYSNQNSATCNIDLNMGGKTHNIAFSIFRSKVVKQFSRFTTTFLVSSQTYSRYVHCYIKQFTWASWVSCLSMGLWVSHDQLALTIYTCGMIPHSAPSARYWKWVPWAVQQWSEKVCTAKNSNKEN